MLNAMLATVLALTVIIHMFNTLAYAVRPAGVSTKRIAIAFSLWNLLFLVSSTANTIQGPLMSSIIDEAERAGTGLGNLGYLSADFRLVLLAATVGTVLGTIMIPSFIKVFERSIMLFDRVGSIVGMIKAAFSREKVRRVLTEVRLPSADMARRAREKGIPKRILLLNFVITGIFTTGVLSALYAGIMEPGFARTTLSMSAVVNGIGQVLSAIMVDPRVATITDEAARGIRPVADVRHMTFYLALSRIAGTLLAQVLFMPAAALIALVAKLIGSLGIG